MRGWTAIGIFVLVGCGSESGRQDPSGTDGSPTTSASDDVGVDETAGPEPVSEVFFELRLSDDSPPPLTLEMNKDEVAELFGDRADEILLLELDSTPLLTNTLLAVRDACGLAWMFDDPDPNPDCSLTPLGQTFMGPDGTWQTSAEYAMVRLLTMTPANVDVSGTTSEGLQELADAIPSWIVPDYNEILANGLAIARTDPIISAAAMVESFKVNFTAPHPATGPDGELSFTLHDALSNLSTLTERYGPQGEHPGVIDPSVPVTGEVFGPDFKMIAEADSNLRVVDGIDADKVEAGAGKGFVSVIVDQVGPSFDDELEFDFNDPDRFRVEGLVEDLVIDMRFSVGEHLGFVPSCTGSEVCQNNLPGAPTSMQSVWALDTWVFEYLVTHAGYFDYENLVTSVEYLLGTAEVHIGQDGNPPGWVQYDVLLDLGNPPEDQYIWETILEVAQVRLHDSGFATFPEGVDLAFTVEDIDVGISGSEAAEAVRPYLQEQASEISDFLLGDYQEDDDPIDFYYRRAEDGQPYVYFVAPEDRYEGAPYGYEQPGFFRDAALTDKASTLSVEGVADQAHEKLALPPGESFYYFQDDTGAKYRARFTVGGDATLIEVGVGLVFE